MNWDGSMRGARSRFEKTISCTPDYTLFFLPYEMMFWGGGNDIENTTYAGFPPENYCICNRRNLRNAKRPKYTTDGHYNGRRRRRVSARNRAVTSSKPVFLATEKLEAEERETGGVKRERGNGRNQHIRDCTHTHTHTTHTLSPPLSPPRSAEFRI